MVSKFYQSLGLCVLFLMSVTTFASEYLPWSFSALVGEGQYPNMMRNDGQYTLGRLSLGKELMSVEGVFLGAELGVQSGNRMRLSLSEDVINQLGGLPPLMEIKAMPDALVTLKAWSDSSVYGSLKAGVAYRTLQWDRDFLNDIRELSPEVQLGLGVKIQENLVLILDYQRIFGHSLMLKVSESEGKASHIPMEQAVLFGFLIRL